MSLKQKIQKESETNTEWLRNDTPKSQRRKSVLFARIEMLNWVLEELDEATKQIREMDNDVDAEIQKFGYEGVYPSLIPCECDLLGQKRAIRKVLAILEGDGKEKAKPT
jgi:hypothetical protein